MSRHSFLISVKLAELPGQTKEGKLHQVLTEYIATGMSGVSSIRVSNDPLIWFAEAAPSSSVHLTWPQHTPIEEDIYLELVAVRIDGVSAMLPLTLPPTSETLHDTQVLLELTPAYRVAITSHHSQTFGDGVYQSNSRADIGIRELSVPMEGVFGLLGGRYKFVGWSGIEVDQANLKIPVTRAIAAQAKWEADITIPAAATVALALLLLLLWPPLMPWDRFDLTRKRL
jgi:hypothetical protein